MPDLGDICQPGVPAPAAGSYQCTAPGCTASFVASLLGTPLPSAHHAGEGWKLIAFHPASKPTTGSPRAGSPRPGGALRRPKGGPAGDPTTPA